MRVENVPKSIVDSSEVRQLSVFATERNSRELGISE